MTALERYRLIGIRASVWAAAYVRHYTNAGIRPIEFAKSEIQGSQIVITDREMALAYADSMVVDLRDDIYPGTGDYIPHLPRRDVDVLRLASVCTEKPITDRLSDVASQLGEIAKDIRAGRKSGAMKPLTED